MRIIVDANPANLAITSVEPAELFEGLGTSDGRKGVIVVRGTDILETARISITVHGTGAPSTTNITIDEAATGVSQDHAMIAVPVTVEIDTALAAGARLRFDVTVTQPGADGTDITATLTEKTPGADDPLLEVVGFDELDGADQSLITSDAMGATKVHEFSRIALTGNLTASNALRPLVVHAHGGISIDGNVNVSATGQAGGPNAGGGGASAGVGAGGPGVGAGNGKSSGGGGGFGAPGGGVAAAAGTVQGDEEITTIAAGGPMNDCATASKKNCGSGGGGGAATVGPSGVGGGGGGTIELTANGTIAVGQMILANGATGGNAGTAIGVVANGGGGGSGGLVLVRGATIATGGINVEGGGPGAGAGGTAGSSGGVGRIRLDAAAMAIPVTTPPAYRGPTFADSTPVITRSENPMVSVFGHPDRSCRYQITSATGAVSNFVDCTFGEGGSNMFSLASLFEGLNTVCIYVDKANTVTKLPEARNCIQLVRLFTQ
jgi:hypothetical protein